MKSKKQKNSTQIQYAEPLITNVIATCLFGSRSVQSLNLRLLAEKIEGARLNSKKFPGLIIRKINPKGTIILFKSLKGLIIGCSNISDCELLSKKICRDLQKILNIKVNLKSFEVKNLIANASFGYKINIGYLAQQDYAYKDDKHPGVLLRLRQIKSAIVFQSGKVILNGAKKQEDINQAFKVLRKRLQEFKKKLDNECHNIEQKETNDNLQH